MSRDPYGPANLSSASGGNRSPRSARRGVGELPTVDRSPSRSRGSPIGRKGGRPSRSGAVSPDQHAGGGYYGPSQSSSSHHHHQQSMGSPYYGREEELGSPVMMDERGRSTGTGGGHHRSRSASRPAMSSGSNPMSTRYQSLDRGMMGVDSHDREFMPIREPRERSLDRSGGRERSLERGMYMEDEMYGGGGGVGGGSRSARQSPNPHMMSSGSRDASVMYIDELQSKNNDLQRELANFKKELELTNQKLGSSMHSIKTFWSPELKKERALRKEESAKYSLINDQLKLLNSENQKQAMLVRQLEEELRMRMRNPSVEVQQQIEMLYAENEHLTREVAILRETIKELELRIETQKQTLQARDESIKKLLEMLQNKGVGGKMLDEERLEFEARLIESENRIRHYETLVRHRDQELNKTKRLDEFRAEIQRRDQEILAMSAKMKTLEEQHQDYQRHIAVLKESLCAKEEHYNMLQADVEELRQRLEEKNRVIEKKTLTATQATQERNRLNNELNELRDHMDIKDRKINVLQRKLDLHEANRKLANGAARAGEETTALKMQLEEQKKQLEEQRRKLDEHKKGLDSKSRQLEEKEKSIAEIDQKLKKRKEKMDQLEAQLQKQGAAAAGGRGGDAELQKRLAETQQQLDAHQKELEKTREDAQRSQAEMERLLQLVQMSQEEQNTKEKMIHDLQQALKNAQAELRNQRSASAQMRDEVQVQDKAVGKREQQYEQNIQDLLEEVEKKDSRVAELEQDVRELEGALAQQDLKKSRKICRLQQEVRDLENSLIDQNKLAELMEQVNEKTDRIVELEEQVQALEAALKDLHVESKKELWEDLQEKLNRKEERILALEKELKEFQDNQDTCKNNSILDINKDLESKTIQIEELKEEVNSLEAALKTQREDSAKLKEELKNKTHRNAELEGEVTAFEAALRDHSHMAELEELVGVVRQKDERIEELEEALRESVKITAERENVLQQEEERRKQIMEKVGKLEQRLLSLQTAHALRCSTCRPLLTRLQELEKRLTQLLRERRGHLQDLAQMKQEALEAAVSEKDAHLALLEVSGIRNARQAEQVDKLQADRKRLVEKLKEENERSMKLLQEYSELEPEPLPSNILPFEDAEDHHNISNIQRSPSSRHNGHTSEHEVDQDSLEAVSPGSTPPPT